MNEDDRILAQRALSNGRLSRDQVEQVLAECGRSGRSFREVAVGRGLASPQDFEAPKQNQIPTAFVFLLFVGLMLVMGLALLATRYRQQQSAGAGTVADQVTAADRALNHTAHVDAQRGLTQARAAMVHAEERLKAGASAAELNVWLDSALAGYAQALDAFPKDVDVRIERVRALELRGKSDLAISDLEIAIRAKPEAAPVWQKEIDRLKQAGAPK